MKENETISSKTNPKQVPLRSPLYLRIILAIAKNKGKGKSKAISRRIEELISKTYALATLSNPLKHLVNHQILKASHKNRSNGKIRNVTYELSYEGLAVYVMEEVIFKKLKKFGRFTEEEALANYCSFEALQGMGLLLKRYIFGLLECLELEKSNIRSDKKITRFLSFSGKSKDKQEVRLKKYFGMTQNLFLKNISSYDRKSKNLKKEDYWVLDIKEKSFTLDVFIEGFLKSLFYNPDQLIDATSFYLKTKNKKFNEEHFQDMEMMLGLFDLYFASDRTEMLSKLNQFYGKKTNSNFKFESL